MLYRLISLLACLCSTRRAPPARDEGQRRNGNVPGNEVFHRFSRSGKGSERSRPSLTPSCESPAACTLKTNGPRKSAGRAGLPPTARGYGGTPVRPGHRLLWRALDAEPAARPRVLSSCVRRARPRRAQWRGGLQARQECGPCALAARRSHLRAGSRTLPPVLPLPYSGSRNLRLSSSASRLRDWLRALPPLTCVRARRS